MAVLNQFSTGGDGDGLADPNSTPAFSSDLSPAPFTRSNQGPRAPSVQRGPEGRPSNGGIPGPMSGSSSNALSVPLSGPLQLGGQSNVPAPPDGWNPPNTMHGLTEPPPPPGQSEPGAQVQSQGSPQGQSININLGGQPKAESSAAAGTNTAQVGGVASKLSPADLELLQPGTGVDTRIGYVYRDSGGKLRYNLNPEGQRLYQQLQQAELTKFGRYYGKGMPGMPAPELIPGKPAFNPFEGRWSDGFTTETMQQDRER